MPRARCLALSGANSSDVAIKLRSALTRRAVESRASLVAAWAAEPRALLREMAALLDEAKRAQLVELWPRMLVLAEDAAKSAAQKKEKEAREKKEKEEKDSRAIRYGREG